MISNDFMPPMLANVPAPLVEALLRFFGKLMKGLVKEVPELAAVFTLVGAMAEHYICAHPFLFAFIVIAIMAYGLARYVRRRAARRVLKSQAPQTSPTSCALNLPGAQMSGPQNEHQLQPHEHDKT